MDVVVGRTALVVGGSSGIGLETARQLAARDYTVHIVGRDAERLSKAAAEVPGLVTHQADAGDKAVITALASALGRVDVLVVTVSGSEGVGAFADLDLTTLRRAFDAKFWAHVTTIQAVLPYLAPQASITLVGAITARAAMAGTAGVGALNAAVEALVKPLAVELAPCRVNAVSPGFVDTPWWEGMPEADRVAYFDHAASVLPARQIATAAHIAEAVVLAATNPNLTGTVIESDAGARLVSI
ncbi:SDR family oxidoreductase [Kribbella monticola]|uniref:SDR family oxidoreductase n=1 Tax=Kribbella monticola TaxID=2185285 RepID=UPI0018E50BB9|nr:SDR family oxidoreductase [Kribbella monticola]